MRITLTLLMIWVILLPDVSEGAVLTRLKDNPDCGWLFSGEIEPGDISLFRNLDAEGTGICLNSQGGAYLEAIAISNLVRNQGIFTVVADGDECMSACAIVFMGGGIYDEAG
jgi:hypothetical protein